MFVSICVRLSAGLCFPVHFRLGAFGFVFAVGVVCAFVRVFCAHVCVRKCPLASNPHLSVSVCVCFVCVLSRMRYRCALVLFVVCVCCLCVW